MEEFFSLVFGIIWIIVIVSIFTRVAKTAKKNTNTQNRQYQQNRPQSAQAQQYQYEVKKSSSSNGKPTFRDVPGSTYGTSRETNTLSSAGTGYGYGAFAGQSNAGKIKTSNRKDRAPVSGFGSRQTGSFGDNPVLLEDRRNDWLARQLREEAAIKRRGSIYDLGAAHDLDCDANDLKRSHARRHNSNGLNKQMFR